VVAVAAQTIKAPEVPLVRIAEVLAELAGDGNPDAWHVQAEQLTETMRGQVTRDWAGKPCLSWIDAERLLQRMLRDRAQANAEIEERLVEADAARRAALPAGVSADAVPVGVSAGLAMMLADPMQGARRRRSVLEHSLEHPDGGLIFHPINEETS
jgi:hypothetical protein